MGTMPTVFNDPNGTPALRTQLLFDIRRHQVPGDIHIMDAFRTPAGRQVRALMDLLIRQCLTLFLSQSVFFNEDTWYMECGSSNDPGIQVCLL
jgi:hypothetical protein